MNHTIIDHNTEDGYKLLSSLQQSFLSISRAILKRHFKKQESMLKSWCIALSDASFFNSLCVGVWINPREDNNTLLSEFFYCIYDESNLLYRPPIRVNDSIFGSYLNDKSSNNYLTIPIHDIYSETGLENINSHSLQNNIKDVVLLKLKVGDKCIGIMDIYFNNLLGDHSYGDEISTFQQLINNKDDQIFNSFNAFMESIGQNIGESINRVWQVQNVSETISILLGKEPTDAIELYTAIQQNILERIRCDHITIWNVDIKRESFILKWIYGVCSNDNLEAVTEFSKCWLRDVVNCKENHLFLESPKDDPRFPDSWITALGNNPILAFKLGNWQSNILGIITLHLDPSVKVHEQLIQIIERLMSTYARMIDSYKNRFEKKRITSFHKILSGWPNYDIDNDFFDSVVYATGELVQNTDCSLLLRDTNHWNHLTLVSTTATYLFPLIGKSPYKLNSNDKRDVGITGKVINDPNYDTLIYKVGAIPDHSGGVCNEVINDTKVSVVYGRIVSDNDVLGVIRCVSKNEYDLINIKSRFYRTLDIDDEKMITIISTYLGFIIKLLNISKEEAIRQQELEHETVTPISVAKNEMNYVKLFLRRLQRKSNKQLFAMLDRKSFDNADTPVWKDKVLRDFNLVTRRIDIAKYEMDITESFIRTPNVSDVPIEMYNTGPWPLYHLLRTYFHHAAHLSSLSGIKLGNFSEILEKYKRNGQTVDVDKNMFGQAFLHVVNNAIKYCKEDNTKDIDVWFEVETIRINDVSYCGISVLNIGIPIIYEDCELIFNKRFSGRQAKEQQKAGKGLGLYVASTVMDNLNGTIKYFFKPDDTVCFQLCLPLCKK